MKGSFFNLYSSCVVVKGAKESRILDLQQNRQYNIPNLLAEILSNSRNKSIEQLKEHYHHKNDEGIDLYFNEFEKLGLGFFLDNPENFPSLDLQWESPIEMHSAIFERSNQSKYDLIRLVELFDKKAHLTNLEIYYLDGISLTELRKLDSILDGSGIKVCDIYMPFVCFTEDLFKNYCFKNSRIRRIIIYNVDLNQRPKISKISKGSNFRIVFSPEELSSYASNISPESMSTNLEFYVEAQHHNVALNRKICITRSGDIKNSLSHAKVFNNVESIGPLEVFRSQDFQQKWFVKKDDIIQCKDCQYRFSCFNNMDVELNKESWQLKEKCSFDPYKNEWQSNSY